MTKDEQIAALKEWNETQAEGRKADWVKINSLKKRCKKLQYALEKSQADKPPTWREQVWAEAEKVFDDG